MSDTQDSIFLELLFLSEFQSYLDSIEPNLKVIFPFLEFFYFKNYGLAHPFILTPVSP